VREIPAITFIAFASERDDGVEKLAYIFSKVESVKEYSQLCPYRKATVVPEVELILLKVELDIDFVRLSVHVA
jgi:hypothetical protein